MTTEEAFTELYPAATGYNLRHRTSVVQHVTGEDCPCRPTRVAHTASKGETK